MPGNDRSSSCLKLCGFGVSANEDVYEPSEDTFLLADSIPKKRFGRVLEMGCGTGILAMIASRNAEEVVATDVSKKAVECARENVEKNGVKNVRVVESSLFSNIRGKFDLIIFNPPYLPHKKSDDAGGPIDKAWDGGPDGRKVTDRFLKEAVKHLEPKGTILLIDSSLADYEKTLRFLESSGFEARIAGRIKFDFEEIVAVEAVRR